MPSINRFLVNRRLLFFIFVVIALLASLQSYYGGLKTFVPGGKLYTSFNNYIIFKQSFFHLIHGQDLYVLYLDEQFDLFKYSPAFALFFGGLSYLPDLAGLTLWNLLNALVLFFSVYYLPKGDLRTKGIILLTVLIELLTSIQNEQSNGLIAGLLIFAFGFLERGKYWQAAFCIVASVYIKLFGIVALALFLLYPNKLKLTYTTAVWILLFTFAPLVVVDMEQFLFLYKSWLSLLQNDRSISDGLSVIGWLKAWFGWDVNKTMVNIAGVVLFCLPLVRIRYYSQYTFRILLLASVLIWVVIFNHRAESPTFIIAMCGVALWYFSLSSSRENLVLLLLAFVFTALSATDVFPRFMRDEWLKPYVIKAVPCILIWGKIIYDMWVGNLAPRESVPSQV
ncbi:hypothetical protein DYBT9275_03800 [Dyadobacter sp. CECT 9275]|uniref:DUF2029 domain-containing protein n=1 Tax=Dyadobacter helix TaxID=2822344 RepID=A0A916JDB3_9BACT|nr:glycosyltransferase family 87 protein [Dyadobacter sp. CECT 9275]CAG5006350.1 hypothetical protein DYBT9275_03800 [Dyadobacter sp. CECT 9275]